MATAVATILLYDDWTGLKQQSFHLRQLGLATQNQLKSEN